MGSTEVTVSNPSSEKIKKRLMSTITRVIYNTAICEWAYRGGGGGGMGVVMVRSFNEGFLGL